MSNNLAMNSKIGTSQFHNADLESAYILSSWLQRSGIERQTILEELKLLTGFEDDIGEKTFRQWTSFGESSKRVSGLTPEIRGQRLVALVTWFLREHRHRSRPIMTSGELRQLINLYPDIPVKNKLQLRRLLHELEIYNGEREANFSFATDWKGHLASWPIFCFVIDPYWCVRATTCYEMALAGYTEEDMRHWSWWHRLLASKRGKPKYLPDGPRYSLRGPYTEAYYQYQIKRFWISTTKFRKNQDPRYSTLLEILQSTPRFNEVLSAALELSDQTPLFGIPVPFFREDGTLLWMLEVTTIIPNTPDYQLVVWAPLNEESAEYQAQLRRWADESGVYCKKAYFIEEFADCFDDEQKKFAFGLMGLL